MIKNLVLLALDGQNALVSKGQACVEEAWDLAWNFLDSDQDVSTVRVIDPETQELEGTVCRRTDRRTGKLGPSYHF